MTNQAKPVAPQRPPELVETERIAAKSALIRWFAEMLVKDFLAENEKENRA